MSRLAKRSVYVIERGDISISCSHDIQFLFAEDILGNNPPPYPRHSKQYRNLYKMKEEMQRERIAGFREFVDDVRNNAFPAAEHVIKAPANLMDEFLEQVDKEGS